MSESCDCPKCPPPGAPPWVMTFADLMSLLMCFFVLLLSFSEIEAQKFKMVAGSLEKAFGVQREVKAEDTPKGTSIIAQEFSPGKPQPTPINEVKQTTTIEKPNIELTPNEGGKQFSEAEMERARQLLAEAEAKVVAQQAAERKAEETAAQLQQQLIREIEQDLVEVETVEDKVIIRIKENGSFPSGSATLMNDFLPTMERITEEVASLDGRVVVNGHTDDVPISTARFRSNWELSSARAVSVLQFMLQSGLLRENQMEVKGLADTKPLVANDSEENRAINRRVELVIAPN